MVRSPAGQQALHLVGQAKLGTLTGLHCELFFAKGCGGTADLSLPRREKPQAERFTFHDSKRELLCVGWYPLILFQRLTGRRVTRIHASTSNYFFAEHQRNDVEDFACLLLEYEGGLQATITVGRTGWASHPSHGIHQIHLVGTEGAAMLDASRPRLEIYSAGAVWSQPAAPHPEDPMGFWTSTQIAGGVQPKSAWQPIHPDLQSDASYFLDCLAAGRDSDVNAVTGAHIVEVILAAYRSAASGQPIEIGDSPSWSSAFSLPG
jgi:predicted dehydrogenase